MQSAVTKLKKKFFEALVLEYPENRDPYTVTTDPLLIGVGAFLNQKQGTEDRVIAYARKSLSENQQNFSSSKQNYLQLLILGNVLKTIYLVIIYQL